MFKVFCGNLPYQAEDEDLKQFFVEGGAIPSNVTILRERETGRSRGFGFVEFDDAEEGRKAVENSSGIEFMGRKMVCNEARPQEKREGNGRDGRRGDRSGNRR